MLEAVLQRELLDSRDYSALSALEQIAAAMTEDEELCANAPSRHHGCALLSLLFQDS
jgi:hypothetical protein